MLPMLEMLPASASPTRPLRDVLLSRQQCGASPPAHLQCHPRGRAPSALSIRVGVARQQRGRRPDHHNACPCPHLRAADVPAADSDDANSGAGARPGAEGN